MKEPGPLMLAADALEMARETLDALPSSDETRSLYRRWFALRSVVYGALFSRTPAITAAQRARLVSDAAVLIREIEEPHRRR